MFDFSLFECKPQDAHSQAGSLRKGFAHLSFPDLPSDSDSYYDLRGSGFTERQFKNWAKREFGYLRYGVKF